MRPNAFDPLEIAYYPHAIHPRGRFTVLRAAFFWGLMSNRLSTDDVAEKDRLDYWQFICGELIGSFELKDYDANRFKSGFELVDIADIKLGHFTGVSQTLNRTEDLIRSDDADDYIVLLESDKTFKLDHGGHQRSGRNGIVLLDISRPYHSNHPEHLDVIDVFIPRKVLEQALGPIRHAAGLSIEADQPSFPVISAFLRSLYQHGAALDAASAARMSAIAVDLIAAGFAERMEQAPPRNLGGAAILCRAQAHIGANIGVSGLGMKDVAAALNLSVRRLHQIAADEGLSLMDWMWERRLLRARTMLADPASRAVSAADIAYQCGFADQAHFSRRFKERFGQSPSECRHMQASAVT